VLEDELADFSPIAKSAERGVPRFRLIIHAIPWGLLLVLLAFVAPRLEGIFAEFNLPLPRFTILVFQTSHFVPVIVPLLVGLLGADWLIAKVLCEPSDAELYRAWSVLIVALPLILIALTLMSLALPLFTLMTALSG
jgi:type II secretory pathway component PulF